MHEVHNILFLSGMLFKPLGKYLGHKMINSKVPNKMYYETKIRSTNLLRIKHFISLKLKDVAWMKRSSSCCMPQKFNEHSTNACNYSIVCASWIWLSYVEIDVGALWRRTYVHLVFFGFTPMLRDEVNDCSNFRARNKSDNKDFIMNTNITNKTMCKENINTYKMNIASPLTIAKMPPS